MADTRPIGFWLKLVDRLIDERFASIIEEHGVTRRQWQLLGVLEAGSAPVDELDQAIAPFLEPGSDESAADHLAELVDSDWITIDGTAYSLTERGRGAFGRLQEVVEELRAQTGQGLTEEQYETTLAALERMAVNLGWQNGPAQTP
ncbi:MAG: MarR family transcriptional regulator [Homoserinimonas sp.]